ncbi:hypothetical protein GQ55_5G439500 [Panicum hallii var. hallii]|uniref:Uncharacterized protein n=1 Tax=Panicum hallii var. hallii TaxID=1504633 RepID=A0A2T7DPL7_9POAL|nr:hypothetical protein GQ55_5G439500 [Panicum hallii var. hallii]
MSKGEIFFVKPQALAMIGLPRAILPRAISPRPRSPRISRPPLRPPARLPPHITRCIRSARAHSRLRTMRARLRPRRSATSPCRRPAPRHRPDGRGRDDRDLALAEKTNSRSTRLALAHARAARD